MPRDADHRVKIDDKVVARLKKQAATEGRRIEVSDALVHGLKLRATSSGAVSYSLVTRIAGKEAAGQIRVTYNKVDGVAAARDRAREDLEKAERGIDPRPGREVGAENPLTFRELYHQWLEKHAKPGEKRRGLKTWKNLNQRAKKYILPAIGDSLVQDLVDDRKPITRMVRDIEDLGFIPSAIQSLALTSSVFSWAVRREEVALNPCLGIPYPVSPKGQRRAHGPAEIRRLWERFMADAVKDPAVVGRGRAGAPHFIGRIMATRLLTGQRTVEIVSMRWPDLDVVARWWNMPELFVMGGREVPYTKNGKPHRFPLMDLWMEHIYPLLLADRSDNIWVFPSPRRAGLPMDAVSIPSYCREVSHDLGFKFTAKDLRTTFVTTLAQLRIEKETRQKLINHMEGETIDVHYDLFDYDEPKMKAIRKYDHHMRRLLFGEEGRVVPFRTGRSAAGGPSPR